MMFFCYSFQTWADMCVRLHEKQMISFRRCHIFLEVFENLIARAGFCEAVWKFPQSFKETWRLLAK